MGYWGAVAVLVAVFCLLGLGAGWLQRRLQLVSVAHGAIAGTGAYGYALSCREGLAPLVGVVVGVAAAAVVGGALTVVSHRIVRDDFALATFAFQIAWFGIMSNARVVTGGPLGIPGVKPLPTFTAIGSHSSHLLWAAGVFVLFAVTAFVERLGWFPAATAVVATSRELAWSLGLRPSLIRLKAGMVYGTVLGVAGLILASSVSFIDPNMFGIWFSIPVLAIAYICSQRLWLVFPASFLLIGVPELLRLTTLSSSEGAFLRLTLSGLVVAASGLLVRARTHRS